MGLSLTFDENFDIALDERGWFEMTADHATIVVQALRVNLAWMVGEWALDVTRGVDYRGEVFVRAPDLRRVRALFVRVITDTDGVDRLVSISLDPDHAARRLAVAFVVETSEAQIELWGFVDPTPPGIPDPTDVDEASIVVLKFRATPIKGRAI